MNLNIYDTDKNSKVRYSLGRNSGKILYTIGLNPSKASPERLDPTVTNVSNFAKLLGFQSFLMLNLYPQRSTDPNNLHKRINTEIYNKNIEFIEKYIPRKATIWAAWGNLIDTRPYLPKSLQDIYKCLSKKEVQWIQYDSLTKVGHPKHPSRKKLADNFEPFVIHKYMNKWD